jgi:S-formylglutathione hydrolase FrmB
MQQTWLALVVIAFCAACSSNEAPPLPVCSAAMPKTSTATSDLVTGAAACDESGAVTIQASAPDLSATGYTTVGPAVAFTNAATPMAHGLDFVLPYTVSKVAANVESQLVVLAKRGAAPAHAAVVSNVVVERGQGKVHFHATDPATFQVALSNAAGQSWLRHFTYRAIGGASMGGFGSSTNFWTHTDSYDAIAVMGADPGPDFTYDLGMIQGLFLSGFCTAADGLTKIGMVCNNSRPLLADQGELGSSFEAFPYQDGAGVGLTLRRQLYVRANRDLARALGNAAYYNPASNYLPPGVPASTIGMLPTDACANPTVLHNFFDYRYNPTAQYNVITFCDGNDSDANGLGKFDPAVPETDPAQILLAVDVNGNGKRDLGEPVVVQASEPYRDVGVDGVADQQEPGYDPVTNPDPNGDDYHYLWNPTGTEKNWRYDSGEPYDDFGIDGVPMATGGCPLDSAQPDCWDFGEGNGHFDRTPAQDNWITHDPRTNIERLTPDQLRRLNVYYDAGIRDFFNAQVSTNSLMGALTAAGQPVRVLDGFPAFAGAAPSKESAYDPLKTDWQKYGRHVYVRYGDPDATGVEVSGDGRHVGSTTQAVHRAQTMLMWLALTWPDGDRKLPTQPDTGPLEVDDSFVMANGRMTPYVVMLPPGYTTAEYANTRFPVVYLGHGLGMDPAGFAAVLAVAQNLMLNPNVDEAHRMPKIIAVIADGACRPGGDVKNGPVPATGDLCEEGTFYTNHPDGTAQMETGLMQLQAIIEQKFRVKAPADVMVTDALAP